VATNVRKTKKFRALVAALGSEEAALVAYNAAEALRVGEGPTKTAKVTEPASLTSKEKGETLVAQQGLTFTKGRVYGGPSLAEAIVRVHKTGKPEVVKSSGVGRTKAVLVYKEESGDIAQQNLCEPV